VNEYHLQGIVQPGRDSYCEFRLDPPPRFEHTLLTSLAFASLWQMAWWDYGYQITGISNRTTIADGNTWTSLFSVEP
jgi:asparagine N-glycosylation enzyme membrane subunit Stt3